MKKKNIHKSISPYPGGIINESGKTMPLTLQGYGSMTPLLIIQEWINKLSQKEIDRWSNECDKWQKGNGHKKYAWKKPFFKKKYFNINLFSKPWEVEEGDWSGGRIARFRTLNEAIEYAKNCKTIFVSITNNVTDETQQVRDMS